MGAGTSGRRSAEYPAVRVVWLALALATLALAAPASAQTAREAALERRLQQLEREMQAIRAGQTQREAALEKRVLELENQLQNVKEEVVPNVVRSGRRDVTVDLYGQANRGLLVVDDGYRTALTNVDNDASSTRFGMRARSGLNDDITFGANIELEIQSNPSNVVNQFDNKSSGNRPGTSVTVDERILEAYVDSKRFGRISVGQGSTASDTTAEQDLSGTSVATGFSDVKTTSGGFLFPNRDLAGFPYSTDRTLSPTISSVFDHLDGLSRQDRLRYDSPTFYGFKAAASIVGTLGTGSTSGKDAALYYSGKLGPVQLAAAVAAAFQHDSFNIFDGSISALHDTGINLTFAAGGSGNNGANRDPRQYYYVKLGYQADWFAIGKTAFAVDWMENTDQRQNGDYGRAIGGYVVQNFMRHGTEVYLGIKNHSLDADTGDYHDVLSFLTGLRVRF